ncbi:MAG: MarR family transcriptional regulator [Treponema sp.]|nr:MarR family transcriptional regulator [Treponema sp.]
MNYSVSSVLSLISKIHSCSADFLQRKMSGSGLPDFVSSHGFILFCLSKSGRLTMGELSQKINRDKSTATVLVKKLEKAELVKIEKDDSDSRKRWISLTEKGRAYNETTHSLSNELLDCAYRDFSEAEKENLLYLLEKLHANLENTSK